MPENKFWRRNKDTGKQACAGRVPKSDGSVHIVPEIYKWIDRAPENEERRKMKLECRNDTGKRSLGWMLPEREPWNAGIVPENEVRILFHSYRVQEE